MPHTPFYRAPLLSIPCHARPSHCLWLIIVWQGRKAAHDEFVKAGHRANDQGELLKASEAFRDACLQFPRAATLISYVNMVLKQGDAHRAWCVAAYHAISTLEMLAPGESSLVKKKLDEV